MKKTGGIAGMASRMAGSPPPITDSEENTNKENNQVNFIPESNSSDGTSGTNIIKGKFTENVFLPDYPRSYIRNRMNVLSDGAFSEAQGYDFETDTYSDTGFQTVRGVQKQIPQLEKEFKDESIEYEDKEMKKVFPTYPGFKKKN